MSEPLISEPGAYPGISNEDYHRNANLLPGPSLSSSGAKTLISQSPYHFWANSPMNPARPPESEKSHFGIGKIVHDMLFLPDRLTENYHILPDGFNAAHKKVFAEEIEALNHAVAKGKTILRHKDYQTAMKLADAVGMDRLGRLSFSAGLAETTIVWKDKETGVWLRCRPDWIPLSIIDGKGDVRVVSDLKTSAPEYCSPQGFQRAINRFGYHITAAFYREGVREVYDSDYTHWTHIVCEKEFPHTVSTYPLPLADIERGLFQMRLAVRLFADCLERDHWPSYTEEPLEVGLPVYARRAIDEHGSLQQAALINSTSGE